MARIVVQVVIFQAERTDRRHLRDVFTGLCPVEMPGFAWENDDASRRIRADLVDVECLAEPDIEDTRHDGVDSIFRMLVRHQFRAIRHLDSDHIRTGFGGVANQDRQASSSRKRREWFPLDVFGQDRFEIGLTRLMVMVSHRRSLFPGAIVKHIAHIERAPLLLDWHGSWSVAELADVVAEPIFDIAGAMEATLHQSLDPLLAGRPSERGEESVPFRQDF
jgi:hypothetical protein